MLTYRVCRDGETEFECATLPKAKAFLRKMKLKKFEQGYVDELSDGDETSLYQKQKTSGPLMECF